MENIKITSNITKQEFIRLFFKIRYKSPVVIIITSIFAAPLILVPIYYLLGKYEGYYQSPIQHFMFSLLISIALPIGAFISAKMQLKSNKRLEESLIYEFDKDKIQIQGETFSSTFDWSKIHKVKELGNYILIYHQPLVFNIISKKNFSTEQLATFRKFYS